MESVRGAGCLAIVALLCFSMVVGGHAGLPSDFNTWTPKQVRYSLDGRGVELRLSDPNEAYTGISSKASYLFGGFGAWIKLAAGDTAGTVTTFYLSSSGPKHCEFDFEFLGNSTGEPYILHTNIFVEGVGGREQQIQLSWFDPTLDFHYYNFQWNKDLLVFYIDNTPIRMFLNLETIIPGFLYPNKSPMSLYLSVWDGSEWATQGGRIKLNWASAPFTATYQYFRMRGCLAKAEDAAAIATCQNSTFATPGPNSHRLGQYRTRQLREVKAKYSSYNYCDDRVRYPEAHPECAHIVL